MKKKYATRKSKTADVSSVALKFRVPKAPNIIRIRKDPAFGRDESKIFFGGKDRRFREESSTNIRGKLRGKWEPLFFFFSFQQFLLQRTIATPTKAKYADTSRRGAHVHQNTKLRNEKKQKNKPETKKQQLCTAAKFLAQRGDECKI